MGEFRNVLYFLRLNMESRINEANLDVRTRQDTTACC